MATVKERYRFFRPELRDSSYEIGDVYSNDVAKKFQGEWDIITNSNGQKYPYLEHVKSLSDAWPHLRLLADFMEVTTTPLRWAGLNPAGKEDSEKKTRNQAREDRATRTNVSRLDIYKSGDVIETVCKAKGELIEALKDDKNDSRELRLFVVEDLSRDVIEALGFALDIEPAFFREQIVDYAWCNIRDRWQDPPSLEVDTRDQPWVQLRYVTARYYKDSAEFQKALKQAEQFNVLRRPDDDLNNKAVWDDVKRGAIVGITRTRASFWLRTADASRGTTGVLLLDPTIEAGTPLWYGYRNWEKTPGVATVDYPKGPLRKTMFDDFIYWAKKTSLKPAPSPSTNSSQASSITTTKPGSYAHVPVKTLLHLVCAEWLTIAEYVRTRIGQIEWEVSIPDYFLTKEIGIEDALTKLHVWRRLVPLYHEMLSASLQRVFKFSCQDISYSQNTTSPVVQAAAPPQAPCQCFNNTTKEEPMPRILAYRPDFLRALSAIEECQRRLDRLTSVVTAIISIEDSRRGQQDNSNVARLTWLATAFIPLSYIASLFSMTTDLSSIKNTSKIYAATAVPLAILSLGLAWILTLPRVLAWFMLSWKQITRRRGV